MLTLEGDVICQWHPLILHTRCNYISNMITEYGIEAKSNSEIISESGGRFKQYRLFSNLTQKEVAVSIFTILLYLEFLKFVIYLNSATL